MSSVRIFTAMTRDDSKQVCVDWLKSDDFGTGTGTYLVSSVDRDIFHTDRDKAIAAARRKLAKLNKES